jgi:hypothetical protein
MGHYAIKNKVKVFQLFDEGKRPADIDFPAVSRNTLYQYYAEWRREKGLAGKKTGFAVKKFIKKSAPAVAQKPSDRNSTLVSGTLVHDITGRDRTNLDSFILDCITILDALRRPRQGALYLPGSKSERFLSDLLRMKERNGEKIAFLTIQQYIQIFTSWMDIAKRAGDKDEFYRLSAAAGINYEAPGL